MYHELGMYFTLSVPTLAIVYMPVRSSVLLAFECMFGAVWCIVTDTLLRGYLLGCIMQRYSSGQSGLHERKLEQRH